MLYKMNVLACKIKLNLTCFQVNEHYNADFQYKNQRTVRVHIVVGCFFLSTWILQYMYIYQIRHKTNIKKTNPYEMLMLIYAKILYY